MTSDAPARNYVMSSAERMRRHLRVNAGRAVLGGVSVSGVTAGFLDAAGIGWGLLAYVGLAVAVGALILVALGPAGRRVRLMALVPAAHRSRSAADRPPQLDLVAVGRGAPLRQVAAARCDDPVYGAGLRVLLAPSRPLVVVPSNRRDVGRVHELLVPLFADRDRRSHVEIDLRPLGIPLPPYVFDRELPEGVQDVDHTLAIKDLLFVPELAAALGDSGDPLEDGPVMWPEHCVDPTLLTERDLVIVGGPDTNFWHGALFEAVAREFARPRSSVPLALDVREEGAVPTYGSRSLSVLLADAKAVFPHTRADRVELDERLYPTYAMVLACRNPFAAAVGRSHWCVFVAGTRSLGTSGAVLALTLMLRRMRADPDANFFGEVLTDSPKVRAQVSAVLCRTAEVEQSALSRDGKLVPRQRRRLPDSGLDPHYSDSYVPVGVDYLDYATGGPQWTPLA